MTEIKKLKVTGVLMGGEWATIDGPVVDPGDILKWDGERLQVVIDPSVQPATAVIKTEIIGNLEWQAEVSNRKFTWEKAKEYAASLGEGWRLPTVQELFSLWDYDKGCCPAFPGTPKTWFWSSSPLGNDYAWSVGFGYGVVGSNGRSYEGSVRCVRDVKGR